MYAIGDLKMRKNVHEKVFLILIVIVLFLGTLNVAKARGQLIPLQEDVKIVGNTIELDSLSLEQKIAQMVIVHGGQHNLEVWKKMQLGGIHLFALQREELFVKVIDQFQEGMAVPFFVSADLEGCLNPFAHFYNSTAFSEIKTVGEAFQKGSDEGKYLHKLGFSINFAPVVDLKDEIWGCRSFDGDEKKVSELAEAYVLGLQSQGILATAKHYPGKTLVVKDPHKELVVAEIVEEDIFPYNYLSANTELAGVMVSHLIVYGKLNSEGVPAVVSGGIVDDLKKDYGGLVITDDTMMLGLRKFYDSVEEMYVAVFKAGSDLVLNFDEDPNEIYHMVEVVARAVESGEISEERIDNSVRKILEAKGFEVK